MDIAARLRALVLERYGDAVLAIFVTSSTAKGLDQPFSDLELTVVVRDGVEIDDKSYVYQGILVEIEYPQESYILRTARRVTAHWPVQADGYRNRLLLFERDGWTGRLDRAVEERDTAEFSRGLHLATTAMIEVRDKMRNAALAGDTMNIRVFGHVLADEIANLVLFLNRRYMTTTRTYYTQAFECPVQPPQFRARIEQLLGVVPSTPEEVVQAATGLVEDVLVLAAAHGIAVEASDPIV